jgi:endonuclease/exonuclease/phosphatase (EEP) superfamily protein YafD
VPTAPKWSWHLTFGSFFHRLQQIKKILEFTRKGADTHILLGDFNVTTWMPDLIPVLRHYTDALKFLRKDAPTYYFIRPIRIDYILTRGVKILDGETVITPFSDHNAIWIQFEI